MASEALVRITSMPLLSIARIVFGLISLLILGLAAWLVARWWEGDATLTAEGVVVVARQPWMLIAGLMFALWSVLGRQVVLVLLSSRDTRPGRPGRGEGRHVPGLRGERLYVEQQGPADAPAVIFTHGWGLDSTIWHEARRDLESGMQVITWDLPGLGRSTLRGTLTLAHLAQSLKCVMALAGDRPVVLVGHSIGGMTLQTLVRDEPGFVETRVAGLVLLNTTYTNPLRTMILSPLMRTLQRPVLIPVMHLVRWLQPLIWLIGWQSYLSGSAHMAQRLGFGPDVTRSQLDHTTLLVTRNAPGVQARGNLAMFRWHADDAVSKVDVPTLVVCGDRDIVTLPSAGVHIAAVADGEAVVVERANHMGPVEQASCYNRIIGDFIRKVCAPGCRPATGTDPNMAGSVTARRDPLLTGSLVADPLPKNDLEP